MAITSQKAFPNCFQPIARTPPNSEGAYWVKTQVSLYIVIAQWKTNDISSPSSPVYSSIFPQMLHVQTFMYFDSKHSKVHVHAQSIDNKLFIYY
uniref:Uncharacterized protein n=1 Tax=Pyxicephalus adspersus TaxID=30357 RepID=A0AAV3B757_PYXAD|nr:TPA: hypothetical protein GDO54_001284 [Pyxicephalus adspersus]